MDREYANWIFDQQCAEDDLARGADYDHWTGIVPMKMPAQIAEFHAENERIMARAASESRACSAYVKAIDPWGHIAYEMGRDPARRLFQVRRAMMVLHLPHADCSALEEFADNLENQLNRPEAKRK